MDSIFFILQKKKWSSDVLNDFPTGTPLIDAGFGIPVQGPPSRSFSYYPALPPLATILCSILCMRERQAQKDALLDLSGEFVLGGDSDLSQSAYICEWWRRHENIDLELQINVSK